MQNLKRISLIALLMFLSNLQFSELKCVDTKLTTTDTELTIIDQNRITELKDQITLINPMIIKSIEKVNPELYLLDLSEKEINGETLVLICEYLDLIGLSQSLQILDFYNNPIAKLPENFGHKMENMKHLYLSVNNLLTLPETFGQGMKLLEMLNFDYNDLEKLPNNFCQEGPEISNLKILSILHNKLNQLPEIFNTGIANLEKLNLRYNQFNELSANFGNEMQNLQQLSLVNNPLSDESIIQIQAKFPFASTPEPLQQPLDIENIGTTNEKLQSLPTQITLAELKKITGRSNKQNPISFNPFVSNQQIVIIQTEANCYHYFELKNFKTYLNTKTEGTVYTPSKYPDTCPLDKSKIIGAKIVTLIVKPGQHQLSNQYHHQAYKR